MEALLLPFGGRDSAGLFVVEIDAGLFAEPQRMRPRRDPVDPEVLADVVKEDVARLDDRAMERDVAVALFAPAAILAIAEPDSAGAIIGGRRASSCDPSGPRYYRRS